MQRRAELPVAFAVAAELARLFAGSVLVLALPVAVFEVIGFAAGGSWNPVTFFENAGPVMQLILGLVGYFTAMWVLAGLLQLVPFLVQEVLVLPGVIRWLTAYRAAIAAARARAGEFASAFDTALRAKGRKRAEALAAIAIAQAEVGELVASRVTFIAAVLTASGIRGKTEAVETLVAIAAAQARAGDREASRVTLATARIAGRRMPGVVLTGHLLEGAVVGGRGGGAADAV